LNLSIFKSIKLSLEDGNRKIVLALRKLLSQGNESASLFVFLSSFPLSNRHLSNRIHLISHSIQHCNMACCLLKFQLFIHYFAIHSVFQYLCKLSFVCYRCGFMQYEMENISVLIGYWIVINQRLVLKKYIYRLDLSIYLLWNMEKYGVQNFIRKFTIFFRLFRIDNIFHVKSFKNSLKPNLLTKNYHSFSFRKFLSG